MKRKIPAIFNEDLSKLILSINEYEPINNGERTCLICSITITLRNIQLLIPRANKKFDYVCNNPLCVEFYNNQKSQKNE